MNFYEILGVNKDDDIKTIKKAYKKLASKYHPDRNPGNQAFAEKFKEINGAYEILSDAQKRAEYDNSLNNPYGGFSSGRTASNFNDIFGDFFNQARRSSHDHKPNNPFNAHEDIFQDIFKDSFDRRKASARNRTSQTNSFENSDDLFNDILKESRHKSQSTQKTIKVDLVLTKAESKDGGVKSVYINELKKNIKVRFPADSVPGRTLKLKIDGIDIVLEIKWFSRKYKFDKDHNVLVSIDINKLKSGEKIKVKTVYDDEISVTVPDNIKIGSKLKLKGMGWKFKDDNRSDMYLQVTGK